MHQYVYWPCINEKKINRSMPEYAQVYNIDFASMKKDQ